jgi:transposase InsO family protein
MAYRNVPANALAIFFCLSVVLFHWRHGVPTLTEAAAELGLCRALASRLRKRFTAPLIELIEQRNRPGPRTADAPARDLEQRLCIAEAQLEVARGIIAGADLAQLAPERKAEIVVAVERLKADHGVAFEQSAAAIGIVVRTLRRWRARHRRGESLAPRSRAPKRPGGKLKQIVARAIFVFASLHPAEPLAALHRRFMRERAGFCADNGHPDLAYTTFARAAGREHQTEKGAACQPRRGRDAPEQIPFRVLALMDTSDLQCFGFTFKLIPFMEAHSREIFAHELCHREKAETVAAVLEQGQERSGGVVALRIDRGTPYLAQMTVASAAAQGIDIRVARAYRPTDKAVIERSFRGIKDALRAVFDCVDLREHGTGEIDERRELARRIASAVIAAYLRWGYPYIPQPYIDGRSPRERAHDAPAVDRDVIRDILDERVEHHEHARTVARELHAAYGFKWSMKRWLKAVRSYTVEDLREGARRFDRVLLGRCFNCDSRRTPQYLLAVLRDVAATRRAAERIERDFQRQQRQRRADEAAFRKQQDDERRQLDERPELVAARAFELAGLAMRSSGFGLPVAQRMLDQALERIARNGPAAYNLAAQRLRSREDDHLIRRWLDHRIAQTRPTSRSLTDDLDL